MFSKLDYQLSHSIKKNKQHKQSDPRAHCSKRHSNEKYGRPGVHIYVSVHQRQNKEGSDLRQIFFNTNVDPDTFSLVDDFIHSSLLISRASDYELVIRRDVTAEDRG